MNSYTNMFTQLTWQLVCKPPLETADRMLEVFVILTADFSKASHVRHKKNKLKAVIILELSVVVFFSMFRNFRQNSLQPVS